MLRALFAIPVLALVASLAAPSRALASQPETAGLATERAVREAEGIAASAGVEAGFAMLTRNGRLAGSRSHKRFELGSVTKAMLLLAYLQRPNRRDRALSRRERALLDPMIRHSSNPEAKRIYRMVGDRGLRAIARQANMTGFRSSHVRSGWRWGWGAARASAVDLTRLFIRLDRLAPPRHRPYVRHLFSSIEASQSWGIPAAAAGWRAYFKGGWGALGENGIPMTQAALLTRAGDRIAMAILTRGNASYEAGGQTIGAIAAALLRGR